MTEMQLVRRGLLAAACAAFALSATAFAQAQTASAEDVKNKLFTAFNANTMELTKNDVTERGHDIGSGKFQKCNGDVIDIKPGTLNPSEPCPSAGGTHRIRIVTGTLMAVNEKEKTFTLRDAAGQQFTFYLPERVEEKNQIRLKDLKSGQITVGSVLEGRAEALIVGSVDLLGYTPAIMNDSPDPARMQREASLPPETKVVRP